MSKRYEYEVYTDKNNDPSNMGRWMNKVGEDGWQLVSTAPFNESHTNFIFMREIDKNDKEAMDMRIINRIDTAKL